MVEPHSSPQIFCSEVSHLTFIPIALDKANLIATLNFKGLETYNTTPPHSHPPSRVGTTGEALQGRTIDILNSNTIYHKPQYNQDRLVPRDQNKKRVWGIKSYLQEIDSLQLKSQISKGRETESSESILFPGPRCKSPITCFSRKADGRSHCVSGPASQGQVSPACSSWQSD